MRKWQDLAAPDDPGSWYDVGNMWPTKRGTYETADVSAATSITAASSSPIVYAFAGKIVAGSNREFALDETHIWEVASGISVDRTNSVTVGLTPMMTMFGSAVICVTGSSSATAHSTSTTFSALAGAPQAYIVCVCANALVYFNTSTSADGWTASDVGDYTNVTSGESASGRIIEVSGPIVAAVPYGGDIYVFKKDAIFRMSYVGGAIKWAIKLVWKGLGVGSGFRDEAVATASGIAFNGASSGYQVYLFDGYSKPVCLNPITSMSFGTVCGAVFCYDPEEDVLCLAPATGSNASGTVFDANGATVTQAYCYYSFPFQAWGKGYGVDGEDYESGTSFPTTSTPNNGVVRGDYYARGVKSSKPVFYRYRNVATGAFYRCAPSAPGSSSTCYLQTSKAGTVDRKTLWTRCTPLLRRRTDFGTDSVALSITRFRELEDTSAANTDTPTEYAARKRFSFTLTDNFARFKVTWTALDVEVDDFRLAGKDAGAE